MANGMRVVIERMPHVPSASAGFLVLTGARDEIAPLAGVSHFLEHMMFKGTAKRDWRDITLAFDRIGSTYNAYTSEDRTMYYGWVRANDLPAQLELLADMMRPVLPEEEFQTERKVILEEIAMSKDQLEHVAFDFLQEKVFAGHPLAWPILGYDATVAALTRDQMYDYYRRRYTADNMMLVVTGDVDPARVIGLAEELCGSWGRSTASAQRVPPRMHGGVDVLVLERFKQQILALTFPAVSAADPLDETASVAATILGGENSRFFWNIMQAGLSPRAGAVHLAYSDCGAMLLYASCQPENCEQVYTAIRKESEAIGRELVQPHEVERVKNRRRTSLAVESEAPFSRLTQIMDDMEHRGYPRTVEQMLADVDAVTAESIRDYLARYPINVEGHLASVGPRRWPESNGRTR